MRHPSILVASLLTAGLVASACSGSSSDDDKSPGSQDYAKNGTFTMAVPTDPGTFDPYNSQLIFGYAALAYDSLAVQQPDGNWAPGLAEEWTVDATSATFTLRPDVTCSDGTALTAGQVADDINYVSDPANASPQYGVNTPTVGLTATGDDEAGTVTVKLDEPFGFLLETIGQLPIMCAAGLEDPDILKSGSAGTGPFVLSEVVTGQTFTFKVREGYTWGPNGATTAEPGTPSTFVLRVIPNETTVANLLVSGEVNFANITGQDQQRLDEQGMAKVDVPASGAWLWFNQASNRPGADIRVRKALIQGLDLQEVIKVNTGGNDTPATGLVGGEPKPCPGDTVAGALPEYDVSAAEQLLDETGWTVGDDGVRSKDGEELSIDLHYIGSSSVFNRPTAELIAEAWGDLGAEVALSGDGAADLNQVLFETGDFDVYMHGISATLPTQMGAFVTGPVPPAGTNFSGIQNADYDRLSEKAQTLTPPEACTFWDQAEQALWRDVDIAPISNRPNLYYLQNAEAQVTGFQFPIPTSVRVFE